MPDSAKSRRRYYPHGQQINPRKNQHYGKQTNPLFFAASKAELEDAKTALRQEDGRTPAEVDVSVYVAQLEDDWKERCHHAETLANELQEAREDLREVDRCLSMYIYVIR